MTWTECEWSCCFDGWQTLAPPAGRKPPCLLCKFKFPVWQQIQSKRRWILGFVQEAAVWAAALVSSKCLEASLEKHQANLQAPRRACISWQPEQPRSNQRATTGCLLVFWLWICICACWTAAPLTSAAAPELVTNQPPPLLPPLPSLPSLPLSAPPQVEDEAEPGLLLPDDVRSDQRNVLRPGKLW